MSGEITNGFYFDYSQAGYISAAIEGTPEGEPINLIGHSLGGSEVIRQANNTARQINRLITVDPVDLFYENLDESDIPGGNVLFFANITASDNGNFSDFVANLGGKVDAVVTDSADVNITSRLSHGDFNALLTEVEKFIEGFFGG